MIRFACSCGKSYQVEDRFAGRQVRCQQCGNSFAIPISQNIDKTEEFTPADPRTETFETPRAGNTPPGRDDVTAEFKPKHDPPQSRNRETARPASTSGQKNSSASPESRYGHHRIVKPHARGGMGQVSVAFDERLKREVALKELFAKAANRDDLMQRFTSEAEITARLEHPGIVPVHAFGTDGEGKPYYTMKLVRGQTLQEAITAFHALPDKSDGKAALFRELIRRFAAVCQTMSFAHDRGIIHRDLKPANIMLGEHGETLVMDWGLAKPFANDSNEETLGDLAAEQLAERPDLTKTGAVLGTPAYMPPEQAAGNIDQLSPQSDVYSLGAVLYQILVGLPPYTGHSSAEIVQNVLAHDPEPPTSKRPQIPKRLESVCLKAMARDPDERYDSAFDLMQDLYNWLDDEPITAQRDTASDRFWRWIRKNRTLAATLFLSVLVIVVVIGVSGVLLERARSKTIAARMLADEMRNRAEEMRQKAEEALRLAAEKEQQLTAKEQELEQAYRELANLSDASEEERAALQERIDTLTGEITNLEQEIAELRALAAQLMGDTDISERLSEEQRAKIIEREMTKRLVETLSAMEYAKTELYAYSTETRKLYEEAVERDREEDNIVTEIPPAEAGGFPPLATD